MNEPSTHEIQSFLQATLTCRQLREHLKDMPDDAPVVFSTNYGDRAMTRQLHPVTGNDIEAHTMGDIEETAYSDSGFRIADDMTGYGPPVVVISL